MLAIIIPYYKLTFFEATLESLANQRDKRFKVYVGDDASPENPSVLLEKYKGKFDFIYHRFESNLGGISLTKQWDRCIALSGSEEWLMILGDDDFLDATCVSAFYEKMIKIKKSQINLVRFATKILNGQSVTISESFQYPEYETAGDSWFRKFKGETRSSLSEYLFLRTSYVKYGFIDYPLGWHSDDKAWLDFSDSKDIYTINESYVFIRISSISISGRKDNEYLKKIATLKFFKNCITQNLKLFSKKQRLELLYACELIIKKNRKVNLDEWIELSVMYFRNFNFIIIVKFIRRIFISLFNL